MFDFRAREKNFVVPVDSGWSCEAAGTRPWTKVRNWGANYTYTSIQEGQQDLLAEEAAMHK